MTLPTNDRPLTSVVLGLDDDEHTAQLVAWTARVAHEGDTKVRVVHVVHRSEVWALASMMIDSTPYLRAVRRHFEHDVIAPLHRLDVPADLTIALGNPARELARIARRTHADAIVVGAGTPDHPHHLARHADVAHHLEHLTTVPVWVCPTRSVDEVAHP
jgi:nucleotide-binding universal stress UspA family protein